MHEQVHDDVVESEDRTMSIGVASVGKQKSKKQGPSENDRPAFSLLSFDELFNNCVEALLLSTDLQLRACLVELCDHDLVNVQGGTVKLLESPERISIALKEFEEKQ